VHASRRQRDRRYAFLENQLRFLVIAAAIEETLDRLPAKQVHSFDSLVDVDAEARRTAGALVARRAATP
jgi:1-deoxy-D-xylulose 5-phosphate reductoisomerase